MDGLDTKDRSLHLDSLLDQIQGKTKKIFESFMAHKKKNMTRQKK